MQAALGSEITVTSLDDKKIKLKIPAGSQHGKLLRLRDEGVPYGNTGRKGDLYIKILVRVPERLSAKAKQLLTALEGEEGTSKAVPLSDLRG